MSSDWEATFGSWGAPPGVTEQTKCENVERAVREAIAGSAKLNGNSIEVFTQGSYENRTNVRQDSDVDICVLCKDTFFPDYSFSQGLSDATFGFSNATYSYVEFKNDVEAALVAHFGRSSVTRGKKAFDVHANTYRIDADVVPCFEHRRYTGTPLNSGSVSGTQLFPDNGGSIINWPRQNYANGVSKNNLTSRRFKALTRILKRLRYEMIDNRIAAAQPIPSYLIECLAWNVPNGSLGNATLRQDVQNAFIHLWSNTRADENCSEWGEINELKYLFRGQPWTRQGVNDFLLAAWSYIGID